jgi:hypothetical protein
MQGLSASQGALAAFGRSMPKIIGESAVSTAAGFGIGRLLEKIFPRRDQSGGGGMSSALPKTGLPHEALTTPFKLAVGAAIAGAGFFAKRGVDAITELKDFSEQTELSTTDVQRLGKAAEESGLEFGNFATALSAGGNSRKDAVESNAELRETFAKYGVTLADLRDPQKTTLDLMKQMARAAKDMNKIEVRTDFRDIFGKGAEKLVNPLLGIDADKGAVISEANVQNVDRAEKAFQRLGREIKVAGGNFLGGGLAKLFEYFDRPTKGRELVQGASNLAKTALGMVGGAFGSRGDDWLEGETASQKEIRLYRMAHPKARSRELVGPGLPGMPGSEELLFKDRLAIAENQKVFQLKEQVHQAELRGMNDEQRRIALKADLVKANAEFDPGTFSESEWQEQLLKVQNIKNELKALSGPEPFVNDSLSKIGGFNATTGSNSDHSLWQEIRENTRQTAINTRPESSGGVP